jgi:hypothetical protein
MLRNALTFTVETVVVLSAPATWLARSLELAATVAHYKQRVKRVVLVEAGGIDADAAALKRAIELIPVPVVRCPPEVGKALTVSRAQVESGMSWAPAHPVLDALRAAGDAAVPLDDLAAIHYALLPDSGFFSVTDGRMAVNGETKDACLNALTAVATSRPAPPPQRGG